MNTILIVAIVLAIIVGLVLYFILSPTSSGSDNNNNGTDISRIPDELAPVPNPDNPNVLPIYRNWATDQQVRFLRFYISRFMTRAHENAYDLKITMPEPPSDMLDQIMNQIMMNSTYKQIYDALKALDRGKPVPTEENLNVIVEFWSYAGARTNMVWQSSAVNSTEVAQLFDRIDPSVVHNSTCLVNYLSQRAGVKSILTMIPFLYIIYLNDKSDPSNKLFSHTELRPITNLIDFINGAKSCKI